MTEPSPPSTALWQDRQPLVLASRSRWRRDLCAAAGIPVDCVPADLDERALQRDLENNGATAAQVAQALARAKAQAIGNSLSDRLVVGADQTLAFGDETLSKPGDRLAAARQLSSLSGQVHELHSALAVVYDRRILFETVRSARLTMRPLSSEFIKHYLEAAGEEVCSSVGAYQLEGLGIHLFASIEGDYTTILGMPMLPLIEFLRDHGSIAA